VLIISNLAFLNKTISKENMGRMKQAYDDHKAREAAMAETAKVAKKASGGSTKPSKKKQRTK